MEYTPFEVTREWIFSNRTQKGAWTRKQIEALGMEWGDKTTGWIDRIVGTLITGEQARDFESGKTQFSKVTINQYRGKKWLLKRVSLLNKAQLISLEEFLDSVEE